jgi:pimeloyl-ACP methyl ester carboxylesterase
VRAVDELAVAIPGADVVVVEKAGHDAHHRHAAAFAGLVRRATAPVGSLAWGPPAGTA